ncbi:hypothetical protein [Magnetospirillum fulvum]|uniref:Uncharacterized protein n=1 Tax=Magnetospirillum fulvum MGU-K5 TaxID=1316936 RepID=S9SCC3_MAGFU|nr:hypothetical protein [Magnetospirillum fulvum]EPY03532.1 hypothetical protein K678_00435 [Magnetospirillum fulvum MGU-K5]
MDRSNTVNDILNAVVVRREALASRGMIAADLSCVEQIIRDDALGLTGRDGTPGPEARNVLLNIAAVVIDALIRLTGEADHG